MATKGRKRKNGKRTKGGRLSRAGVPRYDKGTERVQAMQALYGSDGCDAIGRAYRSGLLGEGSEAKALLDMARQISNAYWSAYEVGGYSSAIADKTGGSISSIPPEKARRREEWLAASLRAVEALGRAHRRAFDQLVIDVNPDYGPAWLDRLCFAQRCTRVEFEPEDLSARELALEGLAMLAEVGVPAVSVGMRKNAA